MNLKIIVLATGFALSGGRTCASRNCWVRISGGSVSGVVRVALRGLDTRCPHMEEHWPRSAFASLPYCP
jgi:hypothetical protein